MTYELAEQLNKAGFPATPRTGGWVQKADRYAIATPTLEELIEACGDNFGKLENCFHMKTQWWVFSYKRNCSTKGKTPIEAVARLWLQLNKKQ